MLFEGDRPQDFIYLDVNSAFETLTGLKNVVGKKVSEVIPGIRESDPELFEIYGRVALTGVPERFETHVESLGMWFSISVYSPRRECFVAVFDVITERKRAEENLKASEERYRELVENSLDVIWSLDEQGRFTYINSAGERAMGYSQEDLLGRGFLDFAPPEENEEGARLFQEVMGGRELRHHEMAFLRASGERFYASLNAKRVLGPDGHPVGVRGTSRDITEQRRLQEHLSRSEKLSALGQMAAGIAHDFNNALTSILSLTQGLLLDAPPGEPRESLGIIEQAARDAALIVRRLQEFAGLKRGREDFALCDLNALVSDALELTRPLWKHQSEARQATIEVDLDLGEVPAVRGNPAEMRQVLTNLIFNAVEAMPGGGRLSLSSYAMPGGQVVLAVSDTGPGIAEEVAGRVFDPFFTTKGPGSSGLGLSMAYGIVTRHSGEISVESVPGEGTTFLLTLPPAPATAGPPQTSAVPEEAARKLRVLLVDDDAGVLAGTRKLLWRLGHGVVCASSGEEALRLFEPGQFDLVVTDLGMPGLSGWNVATQVMRLAPGTPVGLLTGWSETVDPETAQRLGIRFVLAKPFDRLELEECLRRACASPAA
jgi:PAS domain S-box-containing protein